MKKEYNFANAIKNPYIKKNNKILNNVNKDSSANKNKPKMSSK